MTNQFACMRDVSMIVSAYILLRTLLINRFDFLGDRWMMVSRYIPPLMASAAMFKACLTCPPRGYRWARSRRPAFQVSSGEDLLPKSNADDAVV